jgi:hypothetical protein
MEWSKSNVEVRKWEWTLLCVNINPSKNNPNLKILDDLIDGFIDLKPSSQLLILKQIYSSGVKGNIYRKIINHLILTIFRQQPSIASEVQHLMK